MIWIWLLVFAAFVAVETATAGLVSIWFAVGAVGAFFAALAKLNVTVQLVVFAVVSAIALAVTRPLVRRFGRNRRGPTNLDRVIGRTGQVTEDIDTASGAMPMSEASVRRIESICARTLGRCRHSVQSALPTS